MKSKKINYIVIIGFHILLALVIFIIPFMSKIVSFLALLAGVGFVIKKQNRNNEALLAAAYVTGIEVFLRATDGVPVYEFCKYSVIILIFIGVFYSGFSKNGIPYLIYLVVLIPGIIIATAVLNASLEDRKVISFVISGPFCLGICSLYTYQRKVSFQQINDIMLCMGMPIISLTTYLILFNPSVRDAVTGTSSNTVTSGGFGPNQVSTVLGLAIFIFVSRALLQSKTTLSIILNLSIAAIITFRGLVTFSRGGVFTAIGMILLLIFGIYSKFNRKAKAKINYFIIMIIILTLGIWSYSLLQTDGLIGKRYSNQDAAGRVKESKFTGREEIAETEINAFYSQPFLGVGVGKSMELREQQTGIKAASHNEITRLLAEHGSFGIVALLILLITPFVLHIDNRENFLMLPFFAFWLFTINHAAMRIAAPAFVYSLTLLKIYIVDPRQIPKEA